MKSYPPLRRLGVVVLAVAIVTAACGSDDSITDTQESSETTDRVVEDDADQENDEDVDHLADLEGIDGCLGRDAAFALYADSLTMTCDSGFLYIETDNLADHEMMVGITAWNGQVFRRSSTLPTRGGFRFIRPSTTRPPRRRGRGPSPWRSTA